jgi:hypothetical protein
MKNGAVRQVRGRLSAACFAVGWGLAALACGDAQVAPDYQGEPLMTIAGNVEAPLSVGDVEVGILWLRFGSDPVECEIEFSGEAPGACVAACGVPSCEDYAALDAWQACRDQCGDEPDGISFIMVNVYGDTLFDGAVGQTTPVQGAFPAEFRLDLLEPPPDDVLRPTPSGERATFGLFIALDPAGAPFSFDFSALPSLPPWLLGGSGSHLLVFSPDGVSRDSGLGTLLDDEFPPGFQLMEIFHELQPDEDGTLVETTGYRPVPATEATQVNLIVADPATLDWPLTAIAASATQH